MTPGAVSVRSLGPPDAEWVTATLERAWGSVTVARKGELLDASSLPGLLAVLDGERAGHAAVAVRGTEYEIVSLSATVEGRGVGRALVERSFHDAAVLGCRRVWLTTTNNNVRAIAFYQRLGMDLCAFYRHGVTASRRVKPSIPLHDRFGVPIAHELEFERILRRP